MLSIHQQKVSRDNKTKACHKLLSCVFLLKKEVHENIFIIEMFTCQNNIKIKQILIYFVKPKHFNLQNGRV